MSSAMPIIQEHRDLAPGIERLRDVADSVGEMAPEVTTREVHWALEFLRAHLIPHARGEDRELYPVIAGIMGSSRATMTMTRDHMEVEVLTGKLERAIEEHDVHMVRRLLYGLYHLLKLHLMKEEEIYLPLLEDHLTRSEVEALVERMHAHR